MIADYLYRHPRILLLVIVVLIAGGVSSLLVLPRLEDPVLGQRVGVLSTVFPGAGPERIESLVTIPLEEALAGISEVRQLRSNSQTGVSNIVIELQDEVDAVAPIWVDVKNRIEDARPELPEGCFAPQLSVVPLQACTAVIGLYPRDQTTEGLADLRTAARKLRQAMASLPGTVKVDLYGDPGLEFEVQFTASELIRLDLSVADVTQQVQNALTQQPIGQLPGQTADVGYQLSEPANPQDLIADTWIRTEALAEPVRLGDVAEIALREAEDAANRAIVDQQPVIVLAALASEDMRVDRWTAQLNHVLAGFGDSDGDVARVDVLFSQHIHVNERMNSLLRSLGLGTASVVFVVLVLMGWRSMLVVATALPLSALIVLSAMRILGIPIHQMSVTGLIIALGLLIDNAIVIVDDVRSRIVAGSAPAAAIKSGIRHLRTPLFGSTLTTALAFLPIATLPGPPGEFVGTIAVSVILAISASFALAMTVIPAMLSLLRVRPEQRGLLTYGLTILPLRRLYESSLRLVLRVPAFGLLLGMILPVLGFWSVRSLPVQFFPPADRPQILVELELPGSSSLTSTESVVQRLQRSLEAVPEVDRQCWFLGESGPTFYYNIVPRRRGAPFFAQAFVDLKSDVDSGALVQMLQRKLDRETPSGRVLVRQLQQGPPFDAPIEVRICGPDFAELQQAGRRIRQLLSTLPEVIHTRSDLEETIPRITVEPDQAAVAKAGMDRGSLSGLIYASLEGLQAGTVFHRGEDVPVRIRLALSENLAREELAAMPLPGISGRSTPSRDPTIRDSPVRLPLNAATISGLTKTVLVADVGAIVRINGQRTNEVKAYLDAGVLPAGVVEAFRRQLSASNFRLPDGYTLEFGGEDEQRTQAVDKLVANGMVLFAMMLLTLVASFQSFRCAFIIALVGFLSAGLGPLALRVFAWPFGFMSIVGTMGLVGVAINDSIVVLAAIRENSRASAGNINAMVGVVIESTRHIIATTLTTMVGFLPLIAAGGGFWPPLAVTIAGGVCGATFLALYVVPCTHRMLFRNRNESAERSDAGRQDTDVPCAVRQTDS